MESRIIAYKTLKYRNIPNISPPPEYSPPHISPPFLERKLTSEYKPPPPPPNISPGFIFGILPSKQHILPSPRIQAIPENTKIKNSIFQFFFRIFLTFSLGCLLPTIYRVFKYLLLESMCLLEASFTGYLSSDF